MLGKCTNPSCSASFRYLQEGLLFRLEVDPALRLPNPKQPEYYWLCQNCASVLTLGLSTEGKVIPVPLPAPVESGRKGRHPSHDFIPPKPQKGLWLRGVRFATQRRHRSKRPAARAEDTMPGDGDDHADAVAAGSSCQAPECDELALASGPADRNGRDHAIPREFTCLRCEINLAVPNQDELIFQGAQWLLPRVQYA
jgi:hypothetical protein